MRLITSIERKATWIRVIALFCTSAILGTCIATMFFNRIRLNPEATMDSLNFYTSDIFFKNLDIQGEEGRKAYLLLHLIDYLFITQFYALFVYVICMLSRKINSATTISFLCMIPFLSAGADLLENILIDVSILLYPRKIPLLGTLSGIFTSIKMYSIYVIFILILILVSLLLIKTVKKRKTGIDSGSISRKPREHGRDT